MGGGGGVTHFGISESKGGLKHGSRPLLGMDIFWNCPFELRLITFVFSVVFRSYGVGRTGVYCLLHTMYHQIKRDNTVSIYQMARLYNHQRPLCISRQVRKRE